MATTTTTKKTRPGVDNELGGRQEFICSMISNTSIREKKDVFVFTGFEKLLISCLLINTHKTKKKQNKNNFQQKISFHILDI